ncbi:MULTISPECIES: 3-deoxy-7-phosphoheptulonate synthase [Kitasatospora]|uniref:Phospho-2-dehydro-3-deoxyheptonate aldolase n=1 Tax=Kitasatospora setae (strain ATCC 33774 / DSM 43861 / JCM 3304 / KCC A-0304 / NBRC 14216 / KM-6054) TaxID=452652 RepID=E4N8U9_KITSK|nr:MULTISPECIES: 3-deoxy-7-phosphoheptulonate synthase [Kitasatospora]BAJ27630.1 putative phospho-2-dehydro-3-deoxyheptonate aldolase [Kitasatospora setae KM-6054]
MMLRNEGSTTVLLQSLMDSPLSAEVLPDLDPAAVRASGHLAEVFGPGPHPDLRIRRSRLRDRAGTVVSENLITFRETDAAHVIPRDDTPFGLHTHGLGLYERRRIFAAGLTVERFGLFPAGAPGRVYEIAFSDRTTVLVHEVFNPRLVSTAAGAGAPPVTAPADHQPRWPDPRETVRVRRVLAHADPLVPMAEARALRTELAGPSFLLQGGDCAETFADNTPRSVRNRVDLLRAMSERIAQGARARVVTVGRIAGQYAKPRSSSVERRGTTSLPSYLGDAVNATAFTRDGRTPDPKNLLRAYRESAKTLSFLAGSGVYTSHEALLLDYELPQVRTSPVDGARWSHSGHLLWIGERTRSLTGPHIGFAAGIANPIGVKIGPGCTPDELLALHTVLNPANVSGRLTFVLRMGRALAYERTRELLAAASAEGLADRFVSDPMHGNGVTSPGGVKTRSMRAIQEELTGFFAACRETGTPPGGVHLELSGDDVTECVDADLDDDWLGRRYRSSCDPRLNPSQSLRLADLIASLLVPAAPVLSLTA